MIAGLFFALLLVFVYMVGRKQGYLAAIDRANQMQKMADKIKANAEKKAEKK